MSREHLFTFETVPGVRWRRTVVVLNGRDKRMAFDCDPKRQAETLAEWAVNRALLQMVGVKGYEDERDVLSSRHLTVVAYGERDEGFSLTQLAR